MRRSSWSTSRRARSPKVPPLPPSNLISLYLVTVARIGVLKPCLWFAGPYQGKPDATFSFTDNDFLGIATGKTNPQIAFIRLGEQDQSLFFSLSLYFRILCCSFFEADGLCWCAEGRLKSRGASVRRRSLPLTSSPSLPSCRRLDCITWSRWIIMFASFNYYVRDTMSETWKARSRWEFGYGWTST